MSINLYLFSYCAQFHRRDVLYVVRVLIAIRVVLQSLRLFFFFFYHALALWAKTDTL